MRKLILSIALVLFAGAVMAQTNFRQISYQEGVEAAKKEGKLLFIDFYTEWCGPCKALAKQVFPRKEVGDFMNEHFVCLSIDAEKGEGVELSKKFEVQSYPTCLIVRPDGTIQHRLVGGGSDWEGYLERVKRGLNEKASLAYLTERYESGKITKKELAAYYVSLVDAGEGEKAEKVNEELLSQVTEKDKLDAAYWSWLEMRIFPGKEDFELILANQPKFAKNIGKEKLDKFLYDRYSGCLFTYIYQYDTSKIPSLEELKEDIDQLDIAKKGELLKCCELADICVKKDAPRFVKFCEELVKTEDKEWDAFTFNRALGTVEGMSNDDCKRLLAVIDKMSAKSAEKSLWEMQKAAVQGMMTAK